MSESSYYILRWTDADIYPLVEGDNFNLVFLEGNERLDEGDVPVIKLCFEDPLQENIEMADYHPVEPVFSKKVSEVIRSFNPKHIQIFDAVIRGVDNKLFDYFYVYIYNRIECLDLSKSKYTVAKRGLVADIQTIVLEETKIKSIPLEERLIFRLYEAPVKILFHSSVVKAIMDTNPKGIRFIRLEDYYDGIEFT
jgi:hypothetical protein